MSTAKRSRRQATEARSASPLPASKRLKTTQTSHVPTKSGLGFLVDDSARNGRKLDARLTNGVPSGRTNRVDESHAVVAPDTRIADGVEKAREVIDISSAEEESSEDDMSEDEGDGANRMGGSEKALVNGHVADSEDDDEDEDEDDEDEDDEEEEPAAELGAEREQPNDTAMVLADAEAEEKEAQEPSFADLLQARHPDTIDVQASFADPMAERSAMIPARRDQALPTPSAGSLSTVLTQALKTNDRDLLESCFQVTDHPSIRSTIQRIQPQLVSSLLQRLAERIYKRPGRTGSLMVWVQWSMVAHGGYLATQPDTMRKLRSLAQVAHERAQGLQPLLHLKGKLDILNAQLELRRSIQAASRATHAEDEDDEDDVVYIEGQDDGWSDDGDVPMLDDAGTGMLEPPVPKPKGQTATPNSELSESDDEDEGEDGVPSGLAQESDDDESEEEDAEEDGEGMFDIEADEASNDDDDEEASSGDDDEDESAAESEDETDPSDDESEPEIKPPQPKTISRKR